ncbi:Z1 domain-containing protein [Arthrobacter sp. MAHUQ-56]
MSSPVITFPLSVIEAATLAMLKDEESDEIRSGLIEEEVVSAFEAVLSKLPADASAEELEQLLRSILAATKTDIPLPGGAVTKPDHKPWLQDQKTEINWRRWRAYRRMLANKGRSAKVLDRLDHFTDDILDLVGDPKVPGPWSRRGLIIGDVQSGKTQNYLALVNKAADVGYRLIIILSGNTEYLRRQTHERVDEGFIGRDTQRIGAPKGAALPKDLHIGIGKIDKEIANAISLTTVLMDYLQASKKSSSTPLPTDSSAPVVFVLKKNRFVLEAVESWARSQAERGGAIDLPLLLLDDESDYASINTNDAGEDPTAINAAIRKILSRFNRSSYLAVTATPFANIFIDDEAKGVLDKNDESGEVEDLFPEDYIYPLEAPTNYIGIRATFGTDEFDQPASVLSLEDAQSWIPLKHKKNQVPGPTPSSLKEAVRVFLLANAILDTRIKPPKMRSMLINASRFTDVQDAIGEQISEEVLRYKAAIECYAAAYQRGRPNAILDEFKDTYSAHFGDINESWEDVLNVLHKAVADIRVKVYNSNVNRQGEDEYFEEQVPTRQIAIGGDLLSRGLTLEGLIVSYFHRSVGAADTMMQMARWFGYRDGYRDVCRLWISEKTAADYRFIGAAVQELREDLAHMHRNNMTPRDFGLAVQQHPESLLITARNKSRSAVVSEKEINLLGRNLETRKLPTDETVLRKNYEAVRSLGAQLVGPDGEPLYEQDTTRRKYARFRQVPKNLIADLLHEFEAAKDDIIFSGSGLERMVRASQGLKFDSWDVVFMNGARTNDKIEDLVQGFTVFATQRKLVLRSLQSTDGRQKWNSLWVSGKRTRVAGSDDLPKLLDEETERLAIADYVERHKIQSDIASEGQSTSVPENIFYWQLPRPQLMVYILTPGEDGVEVENTEEADAPQNRYYAALKIALPTSNQDYKSRNGRAKYLLNKVAQRYWLADYEELA